MDIIGRKEEQELLLQCLQSKRPEFLVVYGRRRIGKTYLIKEYFNNNFSFYATGVYNVKTRDQLKIFNESLQLYGAEQKSVPKDWFEAFSRLRKLLEEEKVYRDVLSGKRVVFLDELPWMDTARSDFKSALDYFWNSWASSQPDLMLIVCGSATSWIIDNLLDGKGGFYNRITRQIHLKPFSLFECEKLFEANGFVNPRSQIIKSYMVFGGVPYYMNLLDRRLSLDQNIDSLLFNEKGQLYYEYDRLFSSLFKHANNHIKVIEFLAKTRKGVQRVDIVKQAKLSDGEGLTKVLNELEQSGFIRKYVNYTKSKTGFFYQIIDPFVLFCLNFLVDKKITSWLSYINTPGYYAWAGNAFETLCLNHISQIKNALGISGVESAEFSWRSSKDTKTGAQIDLIIDRKDDVINICEMKHTVNDYVIEADVEKNLLNKLEAFRKETGTKKALHLTLVTSEHLARNSHSGIVQNAICGDDLFE